MALSPPNPVFNAQSAGMGIGAIGVGDPNVVFKMKYRWTMEVFGNSTNAACGFSIPPYFVKVAARPNISFEETEINFLNDKMWIPGKATWEAITVTFMDIAGSVTGGGNLALYQWLSQVFNFTRQNGNSTTATGNSVYKAMGSKRSDYTATAMLNLYDGCGNKLETWTLFDAWPQAIDFGDLDYSSSETVDIQLTMRYSQVDFEHFCPAFTPSACCSPCS